MAGLPKRIIKVSSACGLIKCIIKILLYEHELRCFWVGILNRASLVFMNVCMRRMKKMNDVTSSYNFDKSEDIVEPI